MGELRNHRHSMKTQGQIEAFVSGNMIPVEEVIQIESANTCMERCKKPMRLFKMQMSYNWKIIERRHNKCMERCPPYSKIMEDSDKFYTCATECVEEDLLILNVLERKLVDEVNESFSKIF